MEKHRLSPSSQAQEESGRNGHKMEGPAQAVIKLCNASYSCLLILSFIGTKYAGSLLARLLKMVQCGVDATQEREHVFYTQPSNRAN